MLFHRLSPESRSFAPSGKGKQEYQLDPLRLGLALLLFILLIGAAFLAKWMQWGEAVTLFLHLGEVTFGGIIGLFFGERSALKAK